MRCDMKKRYCTPVGIVAKLAPADVITLSIGDIATFEDESAIQMSFDDFFKD